ncbi:MAG: ATP-binding cassette domain-containing protein [Nitrospirota bacterium]
MSLILSADHLWKSHNGRDILRDCSFTFDKVGTYVLTGPNGCGKSTFLRICAMVEPPDRGAVRFFSGGDPVAPGLDLTRRMTLVLPKVGVFNTSVFNNAAYGLKVRKATGTVIEERVGRCLELVGLAHKRNQNALTLSSGETQRLGIARALALSPEILFLDEPTASVDQKNTVLIEDLILTMKQQRTVLVIMTTHDRAQAARLADSLLVMDGGAIQRRS